MTFESRIRAAVVTGALIGVAETAFAAWTGRAYGAALHLGIPLVTTVALLVGALEAGLLWGFERAKAKLVSSVRRSDDELHAALVRRHALVLSVAGVGALALGGLYAVFLRLSTITDERLRALLSLGIAAAFGLASWLGVALLLPPLSRLSAAFARRFGLPWPRSPGLRLLLGVALPALALTIPILASYAPVLGRARFVLWLLLFLIAERPVIAALRRLPEGRRGHWISAALALLLAAGVINSGIRVGRSPKLAARVIQLPVAGSAVEALRGLTDIDRDGFSALLAGGDCAAFDRDRQPLARDVPANGIDEDCDGQDVAIVSTQSLRPERAQHGRMAELGAPPRKFNIVWFLIDAMRADHTSMLGYDKPTTPYLEALAEDALVFERAYSQGAATMLSVQSMLTGMDPGSMQFEKGESWLQSAASQTLIAERLSAFGYDTLFVSGGALSTRLPAVHRGFQRVSEPRTRRRDHPDFRIGKLKTAWNDRATAPAAVYAKELVERNLARGNKPFFLLVYSNDPHEPYARHGEGFPNFGTGELARYDGEIAFVDRYVGMFTDYLRYREGLWENTIFVITSDHGEEFGEHGKRFHGATCNRQAVHVPLVVRIPGLPAKRIATPVALIDIVPTLLEAVGADAGKMKLDGQSLLVPSFAPEAVNPDRPIFCTAIPLAAGDESWFYRGARTHRRAFLRDFIGTNDQLYDAMGDFAEKKNLVADPAEAQTIVRLGAQISSSLIGNLAEIRPR